MRKIFLLIGFATSLNAYAGGGTVGNGGVSVVCRNSVGRIINAQLLDIFEGKELYELNYRNDVTTVEARIELTLFKLTKYPNFLDKLQTEIIDVRSRLIFVRDGIDINPTNDAFPTINLRGCQFEQVANYTREGDVLVSQEIYDSFDITNKAALIVHEAIYSMRRKMGDNNSRKSRVLTAHLMANNGDKTIIKDEADIHWTVWVDSKFVCGTKGTVAERIYGCSQRRGNFATVHRQFGEVYKDLKSGLLWVGFSPQTRPYVEARRICGLELLDGVKNISWSVPTKEEYLEAEMNGIRFDLPTSLRNKSWALQTVPGTTDKAYVFNSGNGQIEELPMHTHANVLCVGREN